MIDRDFHSARIMALVAIVAAMFAFNAPAFAAGAGEEDVPSTSIVPADAPSGEEVGGHDLHVGRPRQIHVQGSLDRAAPAARNAVSWVTSRSQ